MISEQFNQANQQKLRVKKGFTLEKRIDVLGKIKQTKDI
jgi:hypothetical protein